MAYVLMDMVEGHALDWDSLDDAAKKHVLEQLADVFIKLSQHPFSAIGCLYPSESDSATIGPITADDLADGGEDGSLSVLGPFSSSQSYLHATIERNLGFIRAGKAYANARIDAYLVHLYLLDSLPVLSKGSSDSEKFFLKHMDDKGDHILVDDKFNIVGIIDWEWAQSLPKSDAFASPLFLLDVARYYEGYNELSTDETFFATVLEAKGHKELAELARLGRVQHRISHCVGGDVENSDDFPMLFAGLQKLLLGNDDPEVDWHSWRTSALKRYRSDVGLQALLSAENPV
ncbi:unnamed protein product [Somion occarium]|uniref:Aminoglycoside phosphotransferase domain-containing protein n=1 Tax=Somion occarium TaxID=3059160 RepID=A0ABP1DLE1_9APHY